MTVVHAIATPAPATKGITPASRIILARSAHIFAVVAFMRSISASIFTSCMLMVHRPAALAAKGGHDATDSDGNSGCRDQGDGKGLSGIKGGEDCKHGANSGVMCLRVSILGHS